MAEDFLNTYLHTHHRICLLIRLVSILVGNEIYKHVCLLVFGELQISVHHAIHNDVFLQLLQIFTMFTRKQVQNYIIKG